MEQKQGNLKLMHVFIIQGLFKMNNILSIAKARYNVIQEINQKTMW